MFLQRGTLAYRSSPRDRTPGENPRSAPASLAGARDCSLKAYNKANERVVSGVCARAEVDGQHPIQSKLRIRKRCRHIEAQRAKSRSRHGNKQRFHRLDAATE